MEEQATAEPVYPAPGSIVPDQPDHQMGECGHPVYRADWWAGFRTCKDCPTTPSEQAALIDRDDCVNRLDP